MVEPKKLRPKVKGQKFERKVRKTIQSGGLPTDPLDLNYKDYCIEAKYTDKKGYRISLDLLEKIWGQSLSMQKSPYLIIGISRNEREVFMIKCNISIERKDR